jgi:hypothetical protein
MILHQEAAPRVLAPSSSMPELLLCTLNTSHAHASMGLRCLRANLGALRERSAIVEFVVGASPEAMAERLLALSPRVIGFGVYIWNVEETTRLVGLLRRVAPALRIAVGGPEVSHEIDDQPICRMADHVVTGQGEIAFARLARQLLDGPRPLMKIIDGGTPLPRDLALPDAEYDARDLRERHLHVEASRGCPFRCEFCLSALDETARAFEIDRVLAALTRLHERGARRFRFVDRTFNLKIDTATAILDFFLARLDEAPDDPVFAHFELVPDRLPDALRERIAAFPPGRLQFEVGIQTWNTDVQARIGRRQDNARAQANLHWLRTATAVHLHVDLIAGLPGEDLTSFGAGFDRLVSLQPHEIQVGILKRLRGAPIARHTEPWGLCFNPSPPYNVLATTDIPFAQMQRIARFARYWDRIANSGRHPRALAMVLGETPFASFMALTDWLYARLDATHRIGAERLSELLLEWLLDERRTPELSASMIQEAVIRDYTDSGARGRPAFLTRGLAGFAQSGRLAATPPRQHRHLA